MANETFIDTTGVEKLLERMSFESSSQRRILNKSAKAGAVILKDETKRFIPNLKTFQHVDFIRSNVKAVTSKSKKGAGANVLIKGSDVPVGDRVWKLKDYARLVFFGNTETPNRPTKSKGRRGNVQGITFGNPFQKAVKSKGKRALIVMSKSMLKEIQKEWTKQAKRG